MTKRRETSSTSRATGDDLSGPCPCYPDIPESKGLFLSAFYPMVLTRAARSLEEGMEETPTPTREFQGFRRNCRWRSMADQTALRSKRASVPKLIRTVLSVVVTLAACPLPGLM